MHFHEIEKGNFETENNCSLSLYIYTGWGVAPQLLIVKARQRGHMEQNKLLYSSVPQPLSLPPS